MTERAEKVMVNLSLSIEEFGTILGCLSAAAERGGVDQLRAAYVELPDKLRDAQRDMLGPMPVAEGMSIVREIQDLEKATVAQLRYE